VTTSGKFTEAQRAELRDAVARSRIEAAEEMRRLAHQYANQQAEVAVAARRRDRAGVSARDLAGLLAETLTALEDAVADIDDDELSGLTFMTRRRVTDLGNAIARHHRNTTAAAGSDQAVNPATAEGA
jgi:hypothetical protein